MIHFLFAEYCVGVPPVLYCTRPAAIFYEVIFISVVREWQKCHDVNDMTRI